MIEFTVVSTKYDYGDPKQPLSYDYVNFYQGLQGSGEFSVSFLDYADLIKTSMMDIKSSLNINKIYFAVFFDVAYLNNLINALPEGALLILFVHDISFRSAELEKMVDDIDIFVVSENFRKINLPLNKLIGMGFPVNTQVYRPIVQPKKYDLCFIGSYHPHREWLLSKLRNQGYKVFCGGRGWGSLNGVDTDFMVELFSQSRIVLNLSNSISWDARYLLDNPKNLINTIRSKKVGEQLKARVFEVASCRAFQLSYFSFGISQYFSPSSELPMFSDDKEMMDMVDYFLLHSELREEIAASSYKKTLENYSVEIWFLRLFKQINDV